MKAGRDPAAWTVYAVRCRDGSIYTGIATDLDRRIRTHNSGKGGAYTRSRKPVRLIFQEAHPSRSSALQREAQIKRWSRTRKIAWFRDAGRSCMRRVIE